MSTTVVLSQITPLDGDFATLHVKGTVGGQAFTTSLRNYRMDPISLETEGNSSLFATYIENRYNAIIAGFTNFFNSQTISFSMLDNKPQSVVYGSTPYAFAGYDTIEVTATVDTVSTIVHVTQDVFLEKCGAPGTEGVAVWLSKRLWEQAQRNVTNSALLASFTLTP